jgi:enoyl-CoA hydratase
VDCRIETVGHAGVITLDKPATLNALTHDMIRTIAGALDDFEADRGIFHVIIRSTSPKAFSAGGDIRAIIGQIKEQRFGEVEQFYRDEYSLNRRIKRFSKPYIALIDGIVMGGGVGVSFHGSHRVISERITFAMPEVGIGLFPDVGATYFLPRVPAFAGLHLALTGARIGLDDAIDLGLGTHHVKSSDHAALVEALCASPDTDTVIARFAAPAGGGPMLRQAADLTRIYATGTLQDILQRVRTDTCAIAEAARAVLTLRSPTSVAIAARQMRDGAGLSFEACMRLEFRVVSRVIRQPDFPEGVRAVIFDRDNTPRWTPATFEALDMAAIDQMFAPLATGELEF